MSTVARFAKIWQFYNNSNDKIIYEFSFKVLLINEIKDSYIEILRLHN